MWKYRSCIRFRRNNKVGLKSPPGDVVLEPIYDGIYGLRNEKVFVMQKKGKLGLVTYNGRILLEPTYDYFRGNEPAKLIYCYSKEKNKWGLINYRGETVLPQFHYLQTFPQIKFFGNHLVRGKVYTFRDISGKPWYIYEKKLTSLSPDLRRRHPATGGNNTEDPQILQPPRSPKDHWPKDGLGWDWSSY